MGKNTDTVAALQSADVVIYRIDRTHSCAQCEETCWSLEGRASGDLGGQMWETPVAWATHLPLSRVMAVLLGTVGSQASKIRSREIQAILRETQPELW